MKEHGGGSIIAISSTSGTKVQPWLAAYVTSKAGLDMLVRCAAVELAPHGIRVNSVQPGYVPTETMAAAADGPLHDRLERAAPLGRSGSATEVGDAVAFLAGDRASWITGQVLGVDGGPERAGDAEHGPHRRAALRSRRGGRLRSPRPHRPRRAPNRTGGRVGPGRGSRRRGGVVTGWDEQLEQDHRGVAPLVPHARGGPAPGRWPTRSPTTRSIWPRGCATSPAWPGSPSAARSRTRTPPTRTSRSRWARTSRWGGDNPQGLYLSAPINGSDTFRVRARRGSARWISMIVSRGPSAAAAGQPPFGDAVFAPDLAWEPDGTLELTLSPEPHEGNWVRTDEHSATFLVRQFFGSPDAVDTMALSIENVTLGDGPARVLGLDAALGGLARATGMFAAMVPMMQGELLGKGGEALNRFATDVGDPTSTSGGVPGGNAVTARWRLEPDEALVVRVTPPEGCAYWDVQVGNGWYESWDYRWVISGLTCENAVYGEDGSFTVVLSDRDPGTANWLEARRPPGGPRGHPLAALRAAADPGVHGRAGGGRGRPHRPPRGRRRTASGPPTGPHRLLRRPLRPLTPVARSRALVHPPLVASSNRSSHRRATRTRWDQGWTAAGRGRRTDDRGVGGT